MVHTDLKDQMDKISSGLVQFQEVVFSLIFTNSEDQVKYRFWRYLLMWNKESESHQSDKLVESLKLF